MCRLRVSWAARHTGNGWSHVLFPAPWKRCFDDVVSRKTRSWPGSQHEGLSPEVQTFPEHLQVCPARKQKQTRGPEWLEFLIITSGKPDQTKSHRKRGQTGGRANRKGSERVRGKTPASLLDVMQFC